VTESVVTVGYDETRIGRQLICRPHDALTLAEWVRRLEAARENACSLVGDEVYRAWRRYMAGSRVGFDASAASRALGPWR